MQSADVRQPSQERHGFCRNENEIRGQWLLTENVIRRLWLLCIIGGLVMTWCVLDSWNHDMNAQLFHMSEVKRITFDHSGMLRGSLEPFKYTLTLAFVQFAFVGTVFCSIYVGMAAFKGENLKDGLMQLKPDKRWSALVGTHLFGSVLLRSLMMPSQMMSLSLFAATRAVEVPVAAAVRAKVLGGRFGGPSLLTTMLMFAAAWLLFFSYTQIAECLCVWSGFGVALSGMALYIVYAFLLTVPATSMVLQESMLVELQVSPSLMLGIQNLFAAMLFMPFLFAAHWFGFEDVRHALAMVIGHPEVYMTVLWLCVQTACLSAVTVGLILSMNSFWAVAACCLRVVFWWLRNLQLFYITNTSLLSVARPHASMWSFVMVSGIILGLGAWIVDSRHIEDDFHEKSSMKLANQHLCLRYV